MSKRMYIIEDAVNLIGTQLASSRQRAIELFRAKMDKDDVYAEPLHAWAGNGMDGESKCGEWVAE